MSKKCNAAKIGSVSDIGISAFLITEEGDICGDLDYSEWDKLPFYKKIWGNIFSKYKDKYIKIVPFAIEKRPN